MITSLWMKLVFSQSNSLHCYFLWITCWIPYNSCHFIMSTMDSTHLMWIIRPVYHKDLRNGDRSRVFTQINRVWTGHEMNLNITPVQSLSENKWFYLKICHFPSGKGHLWLCWWVNGYAQLLSKDNECVRERAREWEWANLLNINS